ncbi:MAG: hypothetical protein ACMUEM_06575 [Flavobacteriales bacterium AspAUS03]
MPYIDKKSGQEKFGGIDSLQKYLIKTDGDSPLTLSPMSIEALNVYALVP